MDALKAIEKLAAAARQEEPPVGPVRTAVMARIARARRRWIWPLSLFAAASAAAALVILAVGLSTGPNGADPLAELSMPFEVTTLW